MFRKSVSQPETFVSAVIAAAGSSNRMGGENKLLMELEEVPVLAWTLLAFERCPVIHEIIVTCREEDIVTYARLAEAYGITKVAGIVRGGKTRTESVLLGIKACSQQADFVAIHDGARPLVSDDLIVKTVHAAIETGGAAPVVPVKDSIKKVRNGKIICDVPRGELGAVQTPQVFARSKIAAALAEAIAAGAVLTDDCAAAERIGLPVCAVEGSYENMKITTPEDIAAAEALLHWRRME